MNGMLAVDQPLTAYELERLRERFQELWPLDWQNIIIVQGQSVQRASGPSEYKYDSATTNVTWPDYEVTANE